MMLEDPCAYVVAAFQAPPSSDYVPGPEEPEQAPPLPEFVPEPPLPAIVSPIADSPGYIADSDPEDPEEDPKEDLEENPTDYPADEGDDDDDDDVEDDKYEEEGEEHLALADFVPPPVHHVTARMSSQDKPPTPFWSEAEIDRLLAIPLTPPSPLSPLSESPSASHPLPLPSPIILLHTRASVAMMRAAAPSTYILASRSEASPSGTPPLLPIPLPTPSPPLLLPSIVCRAGVFKVTLPPQKRLCISLSQIYEVGESSSTPNARPTGGFRADYGFVGTLDDEIRRDLEREIGYGITDTWDDMVEDMHGTPAATDVAELSQQMTDFVTTSMDASDIARSEVRALRTTVLARQTKIVALRSADHARQAQLVEALTLMMTLQTHVTELQRQQ
ncbi:hypothetical protein Tco_1331779 [Tanacetum coccineum]